MRAVREEWAQGDVLVRPGAEPDSAFFIEAGWAAEAAPLSAERRQIVGFHLPGDVACLAPSRGLASCALVALTPLTVSRAPLSAVREALSRGGALADALFWAISVERRLLGEQVVRNGRRSAKERVGHLLLELYERQVPIGAAAAGRFPMPVGQSAIADALGLSYVHVSRVLTALEKQGLISRSRGEVVVENRAGLENLSGFDAGYLGAVTPACALADG